MLDKLLHIEVALCTDTGRRRSINEDSMISVVPEDPDVFARKGALFVVADGLGGHEKGEVASQLAVEKVQTSYYEDEDEDIATSLVNAIHSANAAICQQSHDDDSFVFFGMGSTCIAAVIHGSIAYIANVGDSRAYLIRNGEAEQISQDHSWVAEQVRAGILTEEQARVHERRNVITRCLGSRGEIEVDLFTIDVQAGDALVLCSDGLCGLVEDEELCQIVEHSDPQDSADLLVACANEYGGYDNITAIVARVS